MSQDALHQEDPVSYHDYRESYQVNRGHPVECRLMVRLESHHVSCEVIEYYYDLDEHDPVEGLDVVGSLDRGVDNEAHEGQHVSEEVELNPVVNILAVDDVRNCLIIGHTNGDGKEAHDGAVEVERSTFIPEHIPQGGGKVHT